MDLRALAVAAAAALALIAASACGGSSDKPSTKQVAAAPTQFSHDRIFAGGIVPPSDSVPAPPSSSDGKSAQEGQALFTSMNCDGCHGGGAVGAVGPSLSARRWRYGGTDAAVFQSIYYGRPHGMPAFGGALPPAMIWKLIAYIRSLPPPSDMPTESWQ